MANWRHNTPRPLIVFKGKRDIRVALYLIDKVKVMHYQMKRGNADLAAIHARELFHQLYFHERKGLIDISELADKNR